MDKIDLNEVYYLPTLSTVAYRVHVQQIPKDENIRPKYVELLKSVIEKVTELTQLYQLDGPTKATLDDNIKKFNESIKKLGSDISDYDFFHLMSIFRFEFPAEFAQSQLPVDSNAVPSVPQPIDQTVPDSPSPPPQNFPVLEATPVVSASPEIKQEETKQEETKGEEPKLGETKQEETKQEETKQEEPKQEETKQEEPKREENNHEVYEETPSIESSTTREKPDENL